ncbi:DNA-binding transcriptional MerR regulator [Runella defluvii]|jgi:DNA-binding transcriptional MerR regulator|uniref:DNA-binding transcriptional MerR regulator n=1 Tax=Runella defluvii TaxID=370973 RepID=A0A7W6EU04_9BACT|nr:MerR family transcriptional regulator [Runella defluvii]MBB3841921.1 DNA-binding transcriptional MerR regulator [Runella defluvii]
MLIGELSNKTGLSRDTIRFYEKQGLIAIGRKERRFNNYKEYSEETLQNLLAIKRIKNFGFTLNETADFLALLASNTASCDNVSQKMLEKVTLIDEKIKALQELRNSMLNGVNNCLSCCMPNDESTNCMMLTDDKFALSPAS